MSARNASYIDVQQVRTGEIDKNLEFDIKQFVNIALSSAKHCEFLASEWKVANALAHEYNKKNYIFFLSARQEPCSRFSRVALEIRRIYNVFAWWHWIRVHISRSYHAHSLKMLVLISITTAIQKFVCSRQLAMCICPITENVCLISSTLRITTIYLYCTILWSTLNIFSFTLRRGHRQGAFGLRKFAITMAIFVDL